MGPITAMRKSAPGVGVSPRSRAIPPSSHSVMPSTATPLRCATIAWAISCARSEATNSTAASTAAKRYAPKDIPGRSG
jgi:hypothetical protein